ERGHGEHRGQEQNQCLAHWLSPPFQGRSRKAERVPRVTNRRLSMRLSWMITAVDAHAGGEPGRVITGGVLDVPGRTMFEKRTYLLEHADWLRKRMLREPRGYPGLCCNVILPPTMAEADAGFVIMEQTDYPPMSGSNTICVTTVLLETGMVPMRVPVTELVLEAPAGLIRVSAECDNG